MTTQVKQWTRPDQLSVPKGVKKAGFRYRFVAKAKLPEKQDEGWEIVKPEVHKRELILCLMPEEMAQQRDAYYLGKQEKRMASIQRGSTMKNEVRNANKDANTQKGREGGRFASGEGKVSMHGLVAEESSKTGLQSDDDKAVSDDLRSLEE